MTRSEPARSLPWTALVLTAIAALFLARMLVHVDPDLFFHLKEGGRVFAEGRFPLVEDCSYTRAGQPMIAVEWMSSAAFAALFRLGGYPFLALVNALMIVAALALTVRAPDGDGAPPAARALICALTAFSFLNFGLAKVQNFTVLLFSLFLYWIRLWESGRRWVPWAMAAALAPWANLHGGFMLGWVLLAGVCGLDFLKERRPAALAPWAAGTVACFLHPNGARAFIYPIWFFFAAPAGRSLVLEWRPLGWELSASPYALVLLLFATAIARGRGREKRFPWIAMVLTLLVLGLRTRKMLPFYALSAGGAAAWVWPREALDRARARWCLAGAAAALICVGAVVRSEARRFEVYGPASDIERRFPREAALKAAELYPGRRLFHPYDWGAYLIYKISPRVPVFVDGRLEPYWSLLGDYGTLIRAAPGWESLADSYRIETALLPPGSALARALSNDPRWKAVGDDGRAVLFARRDLKP